MRIVFNARIALQRKIAWLLLFSFFSLCFIGWLLYFNKKTTDTTSYWINHSHVVIQHLDNIQTYLDAWDSLSRPAMSPAFYQSLTRELRHVDTLTKDNAQQQLLVGQLAIALDSLQTGTGALPSIRSKLTDLMQREKGLLIHRRTIGRNGDWQSTLLLITCSVLVFVFISVILLRLNGDIVLRKQAEQKLKESQTWLESILENSTSLIYIKDLLGRYVMVNRRFREVLEVQEQRVIGHTDVDFSSPDAAAHYQVLDEQVVRTGRSLEIEEIIPTTAGDVYLLSIKFPLLDGNGKLIGIGGIATEITERVQYQHQLIAATREAQSAKSMQELFLANMSHEIRTPMNGIQGMTDLLLDTPLTDQQKEFARIIKRSVNNLLVVVNDVLDFSKIKAGKLAIEKIEFRVKDVVENARAIFAHRIAKKGLQLLVDIDEEIPDTLKGDPYRLNQVLVNLIGNAIKFTEQGWIKVRVKAQERTSAHVILLFSIADSGIGIPAESLPYIFDHFSQAGLDISRRYGGTGLGLAICQQLLQLQGGEITVESRERQGSVFTFRLTYGYNKQADKEASVASVLSDHFATQALSGRRFLVVEDNEVNQQLMDHVLKKAGGQVTIAGNGEEAVSCLRMGEPYDLVIMDLQMPVMDGYAATRYIRQELQLSVPIVAITATALVDEQLRCLEVGMNDYMTKPFEFGDLYKRVSALINPFISVSG
ncbi:MAG TPA: ATP-binding protein [Puia sp.]|nr:ATP-binding protein [Puia sp.]